jgi:transposase-like protein
VGREVTLPAYTAMQEKGRLSQRNLFLLMLGISTRSYEKVLPVMAETVGVSKSQVRREWIEATDQQIQQFTQRRLDGQDILIVYIDGIHFGEHLVIAAIGVDSEGNK